MLPSVSTNFQKMPQKPQEGCPATLSSSQITPQEGCMHLSRLLSPSVMPIRMCSFQQLLQKVWPQLMAVASEGRTSLKHTMHDAILLPAKYRRRRLGVRGTK